MPQHTPAPTPSRAVYGFVMYLSFEIFFIIYLIWAIVPNEYFEVVDIMFLPQRYWAVTVPVYFLIVLTTFAFIIYPALGWFMTPDVDDLRTIRDEIGNKRKCNVHLKKNDAIEGECICEGKQKCYKEYYYTIQAAVVNKSIPLLKDIDIQEVSENLFLK